jgi:hypothetical protein
MKALLPAKRIYLCKQQSFFEMLYNLYHSQQQEGLKIMAGKLTHW